MAVRPVRPGFGLHPAVPAQRAPRRRHRQRALRASRSRPRQRLRRGHDQRAPRWLCWIHGAAAPDGLLRPGIAPDGVGRRGTASPPASIHGARRRGGRVAPGPPSRSRRFGSGRRGSAAGLRGGRRRPGRCSRSLQVGAPSPGGDAPGRGSGRARGRSGAPRLPTGPGPGAQRGRVRGRRRSGRPVRCGDPDGGNVDSGETRPPDPSLRRGRGLGRQGPDPPGVARPPAVRADRQPTGRLRELRPGLDLVRRRPDDRVR